MRHNFIPYEIALRMKHLGFNDPCLAKYCLDIAGDTIPHFRYNNRVGQAFSVDEGVWYNHNLGSEHIWSAPLFQQSFRWFRDEYGLNSCVDGLSGRYYFNIRSYKNLACSQDNESVYEKAELACLTKLIEIAEQKQK